MRVVRRAVRGVGGSGDATGTVVEGARGHRNDVIFCVLLSNPVLSCGEIYNWNRIHVTPYSIQGNLEGSFKSDPLATLSPGVGRVRGLIEDGSSRVPVVDPYAVDGEPTPIV